MNVAMRIALGLAAFLAVAGIVYWVASYEWRGTVLLLVDAVAFLYIALVFRGAVRRATVPATAETMAAEDVTVQEAHIGPTIWPFVAAIAAVLLIVGTVVARWVLIPGVILFVGTAAGWFLDIKRQWHPGEITAAEAHPGREPVSGLQGQQQADDGDRD